MKARDATDLTTLIGIQRFLSARFGRLEGANAGAINKVERRLGVRLPQDMRQMYSLFSGVLIGPAVDHWTYRVMPIEELAPASELILGTMDVDRSPPWIAFCDVQDGNYVAMDISTESPDRYAIRDCFHETFPDCFGCETIATNVIEFLRSCITSPERLYWLPEPN